MAREQTATPKGAEVISLFSNMLPHGVDGDGGVNGDGVDGVDGVNGDGVY